MLAGTHVEDMASIQKKKQTVDQKQKSLHEKDEQNSNEVEQTIFFKNNTWQQP